MSLLLKKPGTFLVMIHLSTEASSPPLRGAWKTGIAMGRAFELLRADAQSHVSNLQKAIGWKYCRFHGLFHDEMAVAVRLQNGKIAYQWSQIDKLFDFLLSVGLRPFIELGPMPKALASGDTLFFHWKMNVTPPKSYEEWGSLVEALAAHCIERYGLDEVRNWYFEVWNEPNLDAFWTGTQEEYWQLYQSAAEALKRVDPQLRVGGPASAEAGWIEDFLEFVSKGGAPADFLSTHAYPQNEFASNVDRSSSVFAPGDYFPATVRSVKDKVKSSKLPDLPIFWTEWSSLDAEKKSDVDWYANTTIDELYAAALAVRYCVELDNDADGLFWWVASDIFEEMGLPHAPFSSTFGLVTVDGVDKASAQALKLLAMMKGPRYELAFSPSHPGQGGIATREGANTRILLWNHVPRGCDNGEWSGSIALPGAKGKLYSTLQVKQDRGSSYESWRDAGEPHNLTVVQQAAVRALSTPEATLGLLDSESFNFKILPSEVLLIEIGTLPDPKVEKGTDPAAAFWNEALNVDDAVS